MDLFVGQRVHVDTDNEEWGERVVGDGTIEEVGVDGCLVHVDSVRATLVVPNEDIKDL